MGGGEKQLGLEKEIHRDHRERATWLDRVREQWKSHRVGNGKGDVGEQPPDSGQTSL